MSTNPGTAQQAKKVITREEWDRRLTEVKLNKNDVNKLVLNYLIIEGYKDVAERFCEESGLELPNDLGSIADRMHIRNAIQSGNVEAAIELINDLDPEILDTEPQLYFHLQQQRLIELIRSGNVSGALQFAQEELAPRGEENPEFLEELEKTMALLAFDEQTKSPVGSLLHHSQRQKLASEVNAAILTAQRQEKDPKLPGLLKMLAWAQSQLDDKIKYPKITNIVNATMEGPDQ